MQLLQICHSSQLPLKDFFFHHRPTCLNIFFLSVFYQEVPLWCRYICTQKKTTITIGNNRFFAPHCSFVSRRISQCVWMCVDGGSMTMGQEASCCYCQWEPFYLPDWIEKKNFTLCIFMKESNSDSSIFHFASHGQGRKYGGILKTRSQSADNALHTLIPLAMQQWTCILRNSSFHFIFFFGVLSISLSLSVCCVVCFWMPHMPALNKQNWEIEMMIKISSQSSLLGSFFLL